VDTLQYNGDVNRYINIVILGDGYISTEQNAFIADATNLSNYFLGQAPWSNYLNYFNVFAIKVISAQSGAKHPGTASDCNSAYPSVPVSNPNNYFGSSFDRYNIHRLIGPTNTSHIVSVLAANFPNYDQVLIVVNSPYYGGSGGYYATTTLAASANEIVAHEIGHSFANLADEYYAGDVYAAEMPNMTQETNPTLVKWKNWYGYNGIGIYQHCCGGNSALWYKPATNYNCKMQSLGVPYCSVCEQTIIESIHALINPIVSYTPNTSTISSPNQFIDFKLTELVKPIPNTLKIKWQLDGTVILNNIDSLKMDQNTLTNGIHTLVVNVTDTTSLLKVDNHSTLHFSTVTCTINKTITGLELKATDNKITCSIYPNPSSNILNISIDLEKRSNVSIKLASLDGKVIQHIMNKTLDRGVYLNTINIENIVNGTYIIIFKIGDFIHTEPLIKQQ
jgi:hypothetical protein